MLRKNKRHLGAGGNSRRVSIDEFSDKGDDHTEKGSKEYKVSNVPKVFYKDKNVSYRRDDIKDYDYKGNFSDI